MNQDLLTLAGSAVVVLFMLGVGWLLGFAKNARLDEAQVRAKLAEYDPAARMDALAIDEKGGAALGKLADGRILIARAMGDNLTLRIVTAQAARWRIAPQKSGAKISAAFADPGFPSLNMRLASAPDWLAALSAAGETS